MATDNANYEALLADLEAEKERVETLILYIKEKLGRPVEQTKGTSRAPYPESASLPPDAFFQMGVAEAVKKYLGIVKRKQTVPQITRALESGGFQHRSRRLAGTIQTTLRRNPKVFLKVGRGEWALDWYRGGKPRPGVKDDENGASQEGL